MSDAAAIERMKAEILKVVTDLDHVSFVNLRDRVDGFQDKDGVVCSLDFPDDRGYVVLWAQVSEPASAALNELLAEGKIHHAPCESLVYLIDGGMLKLPIVKRVPPKGGFKKEHWLPLVFRPGPAKTKSDAAIERARAAK